jgi:hypothetical protein
MLDKSAATFHYPPVKPSFNPFTRLLTRACDRLYAQPVTLTDILLAYPADTLHIMSVRPEHYGRLQSFADEDVRRQRVNELITAARTYLAHERKMAADLRRQGELPLAGDQA